MRPSEIEATTFYRKNMRWAPVRFYMRSVMDAGSMRQGADMIAAGQIGKDNSGFYGWIKNHCPSFATRQRNYSRGADTDFIGFLIILGQQA